jgi:hypothetical protein
MRRRFALPSFDLVDILRMPANGGGVFTFYICRRAVGSSHHNDPTVDRRYPIALTDSATLQDLLQDGNLDALLSLSFSLFLSPLTLSRPRFMLVP